MLTAGGRWPLRFPNPLFDLPLDGASEFSRLCCSARSFPNAAPTLPGGGFAAAA